AAVTSWNEVPNVIAYAPQPTAQLFQTAPGITLRRLEYPPPPRFLVAVGRWGHEQREPLDRNPRLGLAHSQPHLLPLVRSAGGGGAFGAAVSVRSIRWAHCRPHQPLGGDALHPVCQRCDDWRAAGLAVV